jgi:CheY-like chemotaxis protein
MRRVWLLAEDDPSIRLVLSALFETWNVTPLVFADGDRAMGWVETFRAGRHNGPAPELALLGIRIPPGPSGIEIARALRQSPGLGDIAIALMTAYQLGPEELHRVMENCQPDLWLPKPLPQPEKLKVLLDAALESRGVRRSESAETR